MSNPVSCARLTDAQREAFERDGFLIVRDALPPEMVRRLVAVVDRLYAEGVARDGLSARNHWQMRHCIVQDELPLELIIELDNIRLRDEIELEMTL